MNGRGFVGQSWHRTQSAVMAAVASLAAVAVLALLGAPSAATSSVRPDFFVPTSAALAPDKNNNNNGIICQRMGKAGELSKRATFVDDKVM